MKPLIIPKPRFITWVGITACTLVLWLTAGNGLANVALGVFCWSCIFLTAKEDWSQSLSNRDRLYMFIGMVVFIAACLVFSHWQPDGYCENLAQSARHPAFAIPFWVLYVWLVYIRMQIPQSHENSSA